MSKHIGIVACSAEGAALCYRTICVEGAEIMGRHAHPEVSMHTFPLSEYMKHLEKANPQGVAELMLRSAQKLADIGADFFITPDNTIHEAFPFVEKRAPRPWLHIAEVVAEEAAQQGYRHLAVLGTRFLMEGPVYTEKLGARDIRRSVPDQPARNRINQIIFDELVYGRFTDESRRYFSEVIDRMKSAECDAVVLACTEIPLLISQRDSSLPVLDSTRLLARAALREATQ